MMLRELVRDRELSEWAGGVTDSALCQSSPSVRLSGQHPALAALAFLTLLSLLVASAPAKLSAAPLLFHSPDDAGNALTTADVIAEGTTRSLYLYARSDGPASTDPARVCVDGNGAEMCGVGIALAASGTLTFDSFTPEPGASIVFHLAPTTFRLNEIDAIGPVVGTRRLGVLNVSAASASCASDCEVTLEESVFVGADLSEIELPAASAALLTVPEPDRGLLLMAGGLALAALAQTSRMRRRGRAQGGRLSGMAGATSGLVLATSLALSGLVVPAEARAQAASDVIFSHVGAVDPTLDPAWTLIQGGGGGVNVSPIVGDFAGGETFDAWAVYDLSTAPGSTLTYRASPSGEAADNAQDVGWTVRAVIRAVGPFPEGEDFSTFVEYNDSDTRFGFSISADADGDPRVSAFGGTGSYVSEGVGSIYQNYEMVLDPDTGLAAILVDGVERVTGYAGIPAGTVERRLIWGSAQSSSTGRGHFHRVEWRVNRDVDRDGIRDEVDNCRYFQNNPNTDIGGVGAASGPDGIGDACQCGDLSSDGLVSAADVALFRDYLVDPVANPLSAEALGRCEVLNGGDCGLASVVAMERALASLEPGIGPFCAAASGFGAACGDGICDPDTESCLAEPLGCQADCGSCGAGQECFVDEDCLSDDCGPDGTCVLPTPGPGIEYCQDNICNGLENCSALDVNGCFWDCTSPGIPIIGPTQSCGVGVQCNADSDCAEGVCKAAKICRVGSPNAGAFCLVETEVADCGAADSCVGTVLIPGSDAFVQTVCENDRNKICDFNSDCGVRPGVTGPNGEQVSWACGRPKTCQLLDQTDNCESDSECASGFCSAVFGTCEPLRPNGAPCGNSNECDSQICNFGFCVGTLLPNGQGCTTDAACLSGECEGGSCQAGVCAETSSCANGDGCDFNSDCASDTCVGGVCAPAPLPCTGSNRSEGCECDSNSDCASNQCVGYQGTDYCVRSGCTAPGLGCSTNGQCCDFPGYNLSCKTYGTWPFTSDRCGL